MYLDKLDSPITANTCRAPPVFEPVRTSVIDDYTIQRDFDLFTRNSYLKQCDDSIRLPGENHDLGKACNELMQGYKKFPQGSHTIYYKRMNGYILVIRILHKSMDVNPVTFGA